MPSNYGRNRKCRGTLALSNGIVAFRQNVLPTCTGEAKVVVTDRIFLKAFSAVVFLMAFRTLFRMNWYILC